MSVDHIAIGYLGVGVITALVLAATRGISVTDVLLTTVLWPLFGPLLVVERWGGTRDHRELELLDALERAADSPLASALPDAATARDLAKRLREARQRLVDLDLVLARPDFDPSAAERRAGELAAGGAPAAAAAAQLRVRTLGQLHGLRGRYRRELDEVGELIAQLVAQAELVRLDPGVATATSELVAELVARVEGLGELLADGETGETS